MINRILTISSNTLYPYFNQALAKYLMDQVDDNSLILFLFQNERSYVYGAEHKLENTMEEFEAGGLYPLRQLANFPEFHQYPTELNFAVLCKKNHYNKENFVALMKEYHVDPTRTFIFEMGDRCCLQGTCNKNLTDESGRIPDAALNQIFETWANYISVPAEPISGDQLDEAMLNTYIKFFTEESWLVHGEL